MAEDKGIFCNHVRFSYGRQVVLNDVSFSIGKGVTGLLGVNGAGKTTLLNILSTLKKPTIGEVFIAGCDLSSHKGIEEARKKIRISSPAFRSDEFFLRGR